MSPELAEAEARAAAARARLNGTVSTLQAKLEPRAILREAADGGQQALQSGVAAAKRNPGAIAGVGALLVAFVARHRIAALVRRVANHQETDAPGARSLANRRTRPARKDRSS